MRAELQPPPATPGASWRYHIRRSDQFAFSWGFHEETELVLIIDGHGRRLVGDSSESYAPGDLALIGAEVPHTYVSSPGVEHNAAVIVQFVPHFLGADLWRCPEFSGIAGLLRGARRGLAFDGTPRSVERRLVRLGALPPARRTLALLGLLQTLADDGTGRPLVGAGYTPDLGETTRHRIDTVCSFLQAVYHRPVTLGEAAGLLNMSDAAFSRFFHRTMGRTFTEYLNEVRIDAACRLLVETELPVTVVAARSGYRNLSHFNRRFLRRKGTQPRRYRRQYRPPTGDREIGAPRPFAASP